MAIPHVKYAQKSRASDESITMPLLCLRVGSKWEGRQDLAADLACNVEIEIGCSVCLAWEAGGPEVKNDSPHLSGLELYIGGELAALKGWEATAPETRRRAARLLGLRSFLLVHECQHRAWHT